MTQRPFTHLHVHSDYSLLDGCSHIGKLVEKAVSLGMPALALTDHGNMMGAVDLVKECKAAKKKFNATIKPLIGCELYLVYDHKMNDRPKRERKQTDDIADLPESQIMSPDDFPKNQIHHKGVIARNKEGYKNLMRIVSDAHTKGFYYRPRTDMEQLAAHSKGLIGLSGCMNGVASQYLIYSDYEKARKATGEFVDIFGKENYFIEIQDHGIPFQRRIIPGLLKLAREFDLKVIAANDAHYVSKEDWEVHDALLCIQTGRLIADTDRMKYPSHEFYLKSYDEMLQVFKEIPEALDNTNHVAELCENDLIVFGENHYPRFEKPIEISYRDDTPNFDKILDIYVEEKNKVEERTKKPLTALSAEQRKHFANNGTFLFELCKRGLKDRYGVDYDDWQSYRPKDGEPEDWAKQLVDKLDYELAIIVGAGFVDYFLIVWDYIDWARKHNIAVGPGRGSGAGSMVAYSLKITDVEPIRYGLLFERMLNLERVSPPDFDVDFCQRRRDEVVNYVREKYGDDRVANIITYGTFGAKAVLKDLARVYGISFAESTDMVKTIADGMKSLEENFELSSEFRILMNKSPLYQKIYKEALVIEGMVRQTGKHACGIIIGDQPLIQICPLTIQEGDLTTQYAKGPVEDLGLLKMDFLGLKNLTVIIDAEENIRRTTKNPDFSIEKVGFDDPKTYELLNMGYTIGVFQLESDGMQALCRQLNLSKFEEIIALIALYRPGPMQFIDQYIKGKRDPGTIKVPHPLIKDLVEETYGILVYQDQVMEVAQIIAGYTLGDADILRRAMGKKIPEVMAAEKGKFVQGAKEKNNIDEKQASEIFAILEKFAQYGFNKSHSAAYAVLSYRTAYLKANYPVEYMAAALSMELGHSDNIKKFVAEAERMGIQMGAPDINISRQGFTPIVEKDQQSILFGIAAIKAVGDSAAEIIITERDKNGPYKDLGDFVLRTQLNRRVIETLILCGAFDAFGYDRKHLQDSLETVISLCSDYKKDEEKGQINMFDLLQDNSGSSASTAIKIDTSGPRMTYAEKLRYEHEYLGLYLSGHPLLEYELFMDKINTFSDEDYTRLPDRTRFRLCGIASGVTKRIAKKNSLPWASFNFSTLTSLYPAAMFASAYEQYGAALENNKIYIAYGSISLRNDERSISIDQVEPIESELSKVVDCITFIVKNNEQLSNDFLELLHTLSLENQGNLRFKIGIQTKEGKILVGDIASSIALNASGNVLHKLTKHPAVIDVQIDVKPLPEREKKQWGRRS